MLRNAGQISQFGRSFSWIAARSQAIRRDLEIAVSVRRGQTRMTIQENMSQLIGAVFGGIGGGMGGGGMGPVIGIGAGALHLGPLVVAIIPVWLGITYVTARTVYRRSSTKRLRDLENLANRLENLVGELVVVPHRLNP